MKVLFRQEWLMQENKLNIDDNLVTRLADELRERGVALELPENIEELHNILDDLIITAWAETYVDVERCDEIDDILELPVKLYRQYEVTLADFISDFIYDEMYQANIISNKEVSDSENSWDYEKNEEDE